jgi:hypothetical protein
VKINKENLTLLKQIVHISKEYMKDYNSAMFRNATDFFKEYASLKKSFPEYFYKPPKQIVDRRFGNAWQLALNRVHEISKTNVCNSKIVNLGAT